MMISRRPTVSLIARGRSARLRPRLARSSVGACAGNPAYDANPFIRFDFLDALEEANCAVERTGWGPQHLTVEDDPEGTTDEAELLRRYTSRDEA